MMTSAAWASGCSVLILFSCSENPRESKLFSRMRLIGSADREMTFEGDEETGKVRLVYRRSGDDLVVVLEKGGKNQEFRFHRQGEK
jgi:hypothetical protein